MRKIKVMIVDDHEVVREGLKQLLSLDESIEVLTEAASGLECLELLEDCSPDIILMDIRMPGINGIETTRRICKEYSEAKVVMLTMYDECHHVTDAVKAGARGYILKTVRKEELTRIIHDVFQNRAVLDPNVTDTVFEEIKQGKRINQSELEVSLTERELEILEYLVNGYRDRQIAESLFISEHTVRSHIKNIYKKFGVNSKSQAVAKAVREGIICST